VQVKIAVTVLVAAEMLGGCAKPGRDGVAPSGSAAALTASSRVAAAPSATPAVPAPTAAPSASTDVPDGGNAVSNSAYLGCGKPIPISRLWDETTEGQVLDAISEAKQCAAQQGRRLLLEVVAPWCKDCHEMARLDETPLVADILRTRFERVRINIGKWDRHEAPRLSYGVRALATYIVIDPKTSKVLAQTTLEPITKPGKKLSAQDWAAWLSRH
jgi:hypothetical protein